MGEEVTGSAVLKPKADLLCEKYGARFNEGKAPLSYMTEFPNAIEGLCLVAEFGAKKYARNNWKKGLPYLQTVDALLRHLTKFVNGEDVDPESGRAHVDHVSWNALALAEMVRLRPELDDRGVGLENE